MHNTMFWYCRTNKELQMEINELKMQLYLHIELCYERSENIRQRFSRSII